MRERICRLVAYTVVLLVGLSLVARVAILATLLISGYATEAPV